MQEPNLWKNAHYQVEVYAPKQGYIQKIQARDVGEIVGSLGAGRQTKEDKIDKEAGILFYKKVADKVEKGEKIAQISTNKKEILEMAQKQLLQAIQIGEEPEKMPTILDVIE